MRIGIDARMYEATGIGTYLKNLIANLSQIDRTNQYFIFMLSRDFDKVNLPQNFKKIKADYHWYSFGEQIFFPNLIKKTNVDIMHFPHFNAPVFYKGKFVVTIQDLILTLYPSSAGWFKRKIYNFALKRVVNKASFIITTSRNTKNDLIKYFSINLQKINVIPLASNLNRENIDSSKQEEIIQKYGIKKDYLMYIGRLRKHKNILGIIESYKLAKEKYNITNKLVFVGKIDNSYIDLKEVLKEQGLEKDVLPIGYVSEDDLPQIYSAASMLIFPSLYEGFGLPVLDAFSVGTPVITSNTSSLPEVAGDAAVLVDPKNIEEIASGVQKILQDDNFRQSLIQKGYEQVKKFSWEKTAKDTLEVFNKIR